MNEIANELVKLVKDSFHYLQSIVDNESSRLHIPILGNSYRVSEQELRFAFLEQFLKSDFFKDYLYSPETPTECLYRFSKDGKRLDHPILDESGRKANIDLCVFDNNKKRVAIIEFKANNSGEFEHEKDLLKLTSEGEEEDLVRLFVEVYLSTNGTTLTSIQKKIPPKSVIYPFGEYQKGKTMFFGYSLNHRQKGQPKRGMITINDEKTELIVTELF